MPSPQVDARSRTPPAEGACAVETAPCCHATAQPIPSDSSAEWTVVGLESPPGAAGTA
jgi:hypothetical protein